jgi:preprotein translocase subunit SecD
VIGLKEPTVRAQGRRLTITVPRTTAARDAVAAATRKGELRFYDWEPNVLGGRGPDQPYAGTTARAKAERAAGRDGIVLKAEPQPGQPRDFERLYAIRDRPELANADTELAAQLTDPRTKEPVLAFELDADGRRRLARLTKRVAQRGEDLALPAGTPPESAFQRFAIAIDDQLLSRPVIDFRKLPEGLDGRGGVQVNGVGSAAEIKALADILLGPPLAVALKPVSAAGAIE